MTLRIIATGGTFDKRYDPVTGTLGFGHSHLGGILDAARAAQAAVVQELMQIDSLEMTDSHRRQVLDACAASPQARPVIVHGTDSMVDTAQVLGQAGLDKTIVLTGAMLPFTLASSDALFNLGFAMGCARTLPPGVSIAMNAQVFDWRSVRKNRALGVFETLPG